MEIKKMNPAISDAMIERADRERSYNSAMEKASGEAFPTVFSEKEADAKVVETVGQIMRLNPCWIQTGPGSKYLKIPEYYGVLTGETILEPGEKLELRARVEACVWKGLMISAARAHRPLAMHVEYVLAQFLAWEEGTRREVEKRMADDK